MPIILGEPSSAQSQVGPVQVLGPFVFQNNLAANTADVARITASTGNQHAATYWGLLPTFLFLRGISGVINANAVAAAQTLTLTPMAQASAINGTETGSNISGASYVVAGGTTGAFTLKYAAPIGLPFVRGGGTVVNFRLLATGAGAVDLALYLHLEA